MFRNQLVFGNVHQEFCFLEMLNPKGVAHFLDSLLGKGRNINSQHHDSVGDRFGPHAIRIDLDRLDTDLLVLWKENKQLICFIIGLFLS